MARVGGKQALAEERVMQIAGLELKRMNFSSYYTMGQCCITHSLPHLICPSLTSPILPCC